MSPTSTTLCASVLALLSLLAAGCTRDARASTGPADSPVSRTPLAGATPATVVELFTSEGCSSCPPADRVLSLLARESRAGSRPVYTLSFHVDYWNDLGWRDPFSDASYSAKQRGYARAWGLHSVYTPQMVVGGHEEFVGSDSVHAHEAIDRALALPPSVGIALRASVDASGRTVGVDWALSGDTRDAVLQLVLAQREARSEVTRGENSGRVMVHASVVRQWGQFAIGTARSGHWSATIPADVSARDVSVVAYAQDARTFAVLGASAQELAR